MQTPQRPRLPPRLAHRAFLYTRQARLELGHVCCYMGSSVETQPPQFMGAWCRSALLLFGDAGGASVAEGQGVMTRRRSGADRSSGRCCGICNHFGALLVCNHAGALLLFERADALIVCLGVCRCRDWRSAAVSHRRDTSLHAQHHRLLTLSAWMRRHAAPVDQLGKPRGRD